MFLLQLHHPSHPTSRFRYGALARVVTSSDANAGRLDIAASVIDRMRTFTSLCNSVRAIATTEFLQLLQLRRLPPPFISHCIQRLDPTECGFINASAEPPPFPCYPAPPCLHLATGCARDFLCACSIVRATAEGMMQSRVCIIEKLVYVKWLQNIQVAHRGESRLQWQRRMMMLCAYRMMSLRCSRRGAGDGGYWMMRVQNCMLIAVFS